MKFTVIAFEALDISAYTVKPAPKAFAVSVITSTLQFNADVPIRVLEAITQP